MNWCDKLASTPSVGFGLEWHFVPSEDYLRALAPLLDGLVAGEKSRFNIQQQDSFAVSFITDDGFQYGMEPAKIFVAFQHRLKTKAVSGGPPVMQMLSQARPYSQLLPEVAKKVIDATLSIPHPKGRKVTRVGVVTTTTVARDELPPGISRFIQYLGRPWNGELDEFSFRVVGVIERTAEWKDRCIHTVTRTEDNPQLLNLVFDWQRTFSAGHPITSESLKTIVARAEKDSTKYFEDLAEGSRFDEELIRAAAST